MKLPLTTLVGGQSVFHNPAKSRDHLPAAICPAWQKPATLGETLASPLSFDVDAVPVVNLS